MKILNHNSGYVGYARSVRSHEAIKNDELPLSQFNKDTIGDFLGRSDIENIGRLRKYPVAFWKFVAKEVGPTSWHHTSSHFNQTDHYDLDVVAEEMLDDDYYEREYERMKEKKKRAGMADLKYAVLDAQIWGGSRNRPQLIGEEHMAGVQKNDWFYPVAHTEEYPPNQKYNVNARKVTLHKTFDSYAELVKAYPEFKHNSKRFNRKIKELQNKGGIKK